MQPYDQDELRRRAQEVLARRIPANRDERPQPSREPERPQPPEQPPAPEPEPIRPEPILRPRTFEEPIERTERRPIAVQESAVAQAQRTAYDIAAPQRGAIYRALHSRDSLRQALILSEILGPPKALREQDDTVSFGGI